MIERLYATLLCSCGLFLQCHNSALLVDALNQSFRSFKCIPEETASSIIQGAAPFDQVDGLLYTHLHPDHYDQIRSSAFLRHHPDVTAFIPTPETADSGILHTGSFTVEYQYLEHIPCDYTWVKHYVLLISVGGSSIYLAGDAALKPEQHRAFLAGRKADYAFFNAIYLSYPETRALLREAAKRVYIYHMPEPENDRSGICRKAARNLARFPAELQHITVLEQYPIRLELPPMGKKEGI